MRKQGKLLFGGLLLIFLCGCMSTPKKAEACNSFARAMSDEQQQTDSSWNVQLSPSEQTEDRPAPNLPDDILELYERNSLDYVWLENEANHLGLCVVETDIRRVVAFLVYADRNPDGTPDVVTTTSCHMNARRGILGYLDSLLTKE